MAECELKDTCNFFNNQKHDFPAVANYLISKYCKGAYWECSRYKIYKLHGMNKVPRNMFPNEPIDL